MKRDLYQTFMDVDRETLIGFLSSAGVELGKDATREDIKSHIEADHIHEFEKLSKNAFLIHVLTLRHHVNGRLTELTGNSEAKAVHLESSISSTQTEVVHATATIGLLKWLLGAIGFLSLSGAVYTYNAATKVQQAERQILKAQQKVEEAEEKVTNAEGQLAELQQMQHKHLESHAQYLGHRIHIDYAKHLQNFFIDPPPQYLLDEVARDQKQLKRFLDSYSQAEALADAHTFLGLLHLLGDCILVFDKERDTKQKRQALFDEAQREWKKLDSRCAIVLEELNDDTTKAYVHELAAYVSNVRGTLHLMILRNDSILLTTEGMRHLEAADSLFNIALDRKSGLGRAYANVGLVKAYELVRLINQGYESADIAAVKKHQAELRVVLKDANKNLHIAFQHDTSGRLKSLAYNNVASINSTYCKSLVAAAHCMGTTPDETAYRIELLKEAQDVLKEADDLLALCRGIVDRDSVLLVTEAEVKCTLLRVQVSEQPSIMEKMKSEDDGKEAKAFYRKIIELIASAKAAGQKFGMDSDGLREWVEQETELSILAELDPGADLFGDLMTAAGIE